MVDQSHNLKPKIPAMIQTVTWAQELFSKAYLVDLESLRRHQAAGRIVRPNNACRGSYMTDVQQLPRCLEGIQRSPHRSAALLSGERLARGARQGTSCARRQALGMQQNSAYA